MKQSCAPWIDCELRSLTLQRDEAKITAHKSGCFLDKSLYCKLGNKVTKLNYIRKKEYFKQKKPQKTPKKHCSVNDYEKIWQPQNEPM